MTRLTGGPEKGLVMVKEPIWGKDSVRLAEVKMSHDFEVLVRKMPVHLRLLPASLRTRIIRLEKFMNARTGFKPATRWNHTSSSSDVYYTQDLL